MKLSLVLCSIALLACSSVAMASVRHNYDQQTAERPPRVQLPAGSFLGAHLSEVSRETVQRLKLREERGALIEEVISGSSAARAGLQKNDVVVKWDGELIESAREMSRHIRETPAGRMVRLSVIRDGREIGISVKLGERTSLVSRPTTRMMFRPEVQARQPVRDRGLLGVELRSMTPQLAEYFGLSKRTGALVVFVFADSPAAKAGLKAGDVILNVGGEKVENPMDLRQALTTKSEGSVEFRVLRDKQEHILTVQLEKGTSSWPLEPDDYGDAVVGRVALAPMVIHVPKFRMVPMAIAMPKIVLAPMVIQAPKIDLAPMVIQMPKIKIPAAAIAMPKIGLAPMVIQMPKIKIAPQALPAPKILAPKIKIPPAKVVVIPRRIVL